MYEYVPDDMKGMRQWVLWGLSDEHMKKPCCPFRPEIGARANDASTWGSFDEAVKAVSELGRGGIGFEFGAEGAPSGIAGIDLDHVIAEDGSLKEFAADIVRTMDSYTEYSPSGEGLHILFRLNMPLSAIGSRNRDAGLGLEIYDTGRYFTVTGNVYGSERPLSERTEALKQVYIKYLAKSDRNDTQHASTVEVCIENMTDRELWERMFASQHGREIRALYQGDIGSYPSASEADLALCSYLAFWTGKDAGRMDNMFRFSGLMRPKWDEKHGEQTYGNMTIQRAIETVSEVYNPKYHESAAGQKAPTPVDNEGNDEAARLQFEHEAAAYCLDGFIEYVMASREGKAIPTAFNHLDALLEGGLYPGLYIVGAISSLGKTTFCTQIADAIASAGHGVLIFSLEMSRYELIAKSLSRQTLINDLACNGTARNASSTRDILRQNFGDGITGLVFRQAFEKYKTYAMNIHITEGNGDVGISTVKEKTEQFMKYTGKPPVVIIDYLQILAPYSERLTDKQNVDKNVLELKRLSRDKNITVIGISSFNRENYSAPVSMGSFKESGAIEYSSDVLIGLQYKGWDYQEGETKERRIQRLNLIRSSAPKKFMTDRTAYEEIQAKILKNRNGRRGDVEMKFYPVFNYFEESEG